MEVFTIPIMSVSVIYKGVDNKEDNLLSNPYLLLTVIVLAGWLTQTRTAVGTKTRLSHMSLSLSQMSKTQKRKYVCCVRPEKE